MTPDQEQIAELIISEMKRQKGSINWKPFRDANSIDGMDMSIVVKALRELGIIENFQDDTTIIRLTEKEGWTFPGFEAQRHTSQSQQSFNEEKDKYDLLTKRFIYKARFVPYIISGLALFLSIFAYFKKPEKEKSSKQSEQLLTQPSTNTKILSQSDTVQRTTPK